MVTAVTCGILEHEVRKVLEGLEVDVVALPGKLHVYPDALKERLEKELEQTTDCCTVVVYGKCFKGIDDMCREHGAVRVEGETCYEMVAGELFSRLLKEEPGTYFLLPQFCDQFKDLTDMLRLEEEKDTYFRHYTRCIILDTGISSGTTCLKIAQRLGLPCETVFVGTEILETRLRRALD
ncbi:MAG: DUF1638 domain-containing protein [Theionarchaea archaeon]|nr:DUF1638 domain-containing protein [Theionarchaea archaeon]MBU6999173.1 DUF1638 domain-containing protein [Theionarchaea archaeon]MBU7019532.1 DUF1638 domain-containing protein [Theionarchaea archaeon]